MARFNEDKTDITLYTKTENREEQIPRIEAFEEWIAYWRENIHRFPEDYLGIKLRRFQEVLMYAMDNNDKTIIIATRGMGKSFLTGLYAVCIAILYPNSKIVIITKTMRQAERLITEKIESELYTLSPVLRKEIDKFGYESTVKTVFFRNGSKIKAANLGESTRGMRATVLILDEAVQLDKFSLETVGIPLLNQVRSRPFAGEEKYAGYPERLNKEIYLTSGWFKAHYFYKDYFLPNIREMMLGHPMFCLSLCEKTPLRAGILQQGKIDDFKKKMTPMQYAMEIEGKFYGENANSFFSADEVNSCRVLNETFLQMSAVDYTLYKTLGTKQQRYAMEDGEFRILSCDIALEAGNRNDNSVYTLIRTIPDNKDWTTYRKEVSYIESHNGVSAEEQAVLIKRQFYDFECMAMIIDANGIGMTVYNELKKETYDSERDVYYPAWESFNLNDVPIGYKSCNIEYVMYCMKASAQSNSDMALYIKADLATKRLRLPKDEIDASSYLEETYNYSNLPSDEQARILQTYREARHLFIEMINLSYFLNKNLVSIKEKGKSRKDRYSSLAYGVYLSEYILKEKTSKNKQRKIVFFA